MEEFDAQRFVLPALLTLSILGAFLIIVTNGGGDEPAGAVDRPARTTTTTKSRTSATPAVAVSPSGRRFIKVQAGDTPTAIADRSGLSTERLLELNPSADPGSLKPGQTLKLAP